MAKKGNAVKVRLESEAGTGYRYYAKRSPRAEYKIQKKKYDPIARKHVLFVEKKMPPSKKN